jgi:hypothetical protein
MGISMASLLARVSKYDGEETISEMRRDPWHRIAVRTESFKYIWDSKKPDQPELYDLRTDPGEKLNMRDHFSQEVSRFQASVDAHRSCDSDRTCDGSSKIRWMRKSPEGCAIGLFSITWLQTG